MPKKQKKPSQTVSEASPQREIVLSPLFELKDPRYKVRYAEMTEEEIQQAARQLVELCLDAYEREHGHLPPPPSEQEFHRVWDEVMKKERKS